MRGAHVTRAVSLGNVNGDADATVIETGTSGLTAAAYLAALAHRMVVVDRQPMPGG